MSFLDGLSSCTLQQLTDIIGGGILSTISVINTKYSNGNEEFSGTGLIVSDRSKKYIFTANHVIDPSKRIPPRSENVEKTFHSIGLKKDKQSKLYPLCQSYFCSETQDLAIGESLTSERLDIDSKVDYYPIENVLNPIPFNISNEDFFVLCGFPAQKKTQIHVTRETNHEMLNHFFQGHHGRQDPDSSTRFRIKYDGDKVHPGGLSGSPVWIIRNANNSDNPLTINQLKQLSGEKAAFIVHVIGIVVEYFAETSEISAVKSDVCAEFVRQARERLPNLRSQTEDEWINMRH
ncbi:MAG: hypothetical protein AB2731_10145 [Candidatus Thiodiazotropha sp.]